MKLSRENLKSSISVFLVALPLCLGLAVASGAAPVSGLIAGIVGGIVVGYISNSPVSVSGPAAGLTVVVVNAIAAMGGFPQFLAALILAGVFQLAFGFFRAGIIGNFFPTSVIQGLLSSIGLLLIFKQLPHAVGYDVNYEGDDAFITQTGENTFGEIWTALHNFEIHAVAIFTLCIAFFIVYDQLSKRKVRYTLAIPGPLAVVLLGIALNFIFSAFFPSTALQAQHLVQLPHFSGLFAAMTFPDFSAFLNPVVFTTGMTIAVIASLETLLNIDAADKLDPQKRITSRDRELIAQGTGNLICGFLGAIPVTSVVVRTTVNVTSGATNKSSGIIHGFWLFLSVFLAPIINLIPLSSLAAILIMVGYKLCNPDVFKVMFKKGWNQFLPFVTTIVAILFTNLLTGTIIGIIVGLFFVIRSNFYYAILVVNEGKNYLIRMQKDITFLNKAHLRKILAEIPDHSHLIIDGSKTVHIDTDIMDTIRDFMEQARFRNITVELKKSRSALSPMFMEIQ